MRYKGLLCIGSFTPDAELVRVKAGKSIAESRVGIATSFHDFMLLS